MSVYLMRQPRPETSWLAWVTERGRSSRITEPWRILYEGDLVIASDVRHVLERERLRARYLSVRARLADHHFAVGDYASALRNALDLLAHDPCREDAHRMTMRCYVRRGERAPALRQYRVCREILALEFDVSPE